MEDYLVYKISELENFEDIMTDSKENWLRRFKKWFVGEADGYGKYVVQNGFGYDVDKAQIPLMCEQMEIASRSMQKKLISECEVYPETVGWFRVARERYHRRRRIYKIYLKRGWRYCLSHPFVLWHILRKCRKADLNVKIRQLLSLACNRFIKEGGTCESFKQYMLS